MAIKWSPALPPLPLDRLAGKNQHQQSTDRDQQTMQNLNALHLDPGRKSEANRNQPDEQSSSSSATSNHAQEPIADPATEEANDQPTNNSNAAESSESSDWEELATNAQESMRRAASEMEQNITEQMAALNIEENASFRISSKLKSWQVTIMERIIFTYHTPTGPRNSKSRALTEDEKLTYGERLQMEKLSMNRHRSQKRGYLNCPSFGRHARARWTGECPT